MISKKRLVLISVLTILLIVGGLYATYAINVFEEETSPTEYDMAFNFDLSGSVTREMTVEAGKAKVFDIDITNQYSDTVQYGVAYSLVTPTTLPSDVTIAESSLSKNSAVGMIDANETLSISVIVVNESSSSVTLSFSVINGYKNGGDLIVEDNETLVENIYNAIPEIDTSGANAPELTDNLVPVYYDEQVNTWKTADSTNYNTNWYNYGKKKWANAVLLTKNKRDSLEKDAEGRYLSGQIIGDTEASGTLAFYVWIPRYKYKVWNINKVSDSSQYSYDAYEKGIDILFEKGKSTTGTIKCSYDFKITEGNGLSESCSNNGVDNYYTHPAFTFGTDELTGIWMGKFELSSETPTAANGGGESILLVPRILPNVISWRGNYLDNYWKVIYDMQKSSNIYGISTDKTKVDTHPISNIEWGAVTYLAHSEFGKCTGGENSVCEEVFPNNSGNLTELSTITGRSAGAISKNVNQIKVQYPTSGSSDTSRYFEYGYYTYEGEIVNYNGTIGNIASDRTLGTKASTTGNIYGIYDMNAGTYEIVMGNTSSTSGSYIYYPSSNKTIYYTYNGYEKYITTYSYGTTMTDQNAYNRSRLGDAIGEIMLGSNAWGTTGISFPNSNYPWFIRGSGFFSVPNSGIFNYIYDSGSNLTSITTRAVLVVFS